MYTYIIYITYICSKNTFYLEVRRKGRKKVRKIVRVTHSRENMQYSKFGEKPCTQPMIKRRKPTSQEG